jgi:ectoine hydroxylase-related dioxygenase (phytanoyl-CoA dioxygenase family)
MPGIILHRMAPRFPVPTKLIEPANHLLRDFDACRDVWATDGCLLLRDVFDAGRVAEARLDLTHRLHQQGAVVADGDRPVWSGAPVAAIDAFSLYEGDPAFVRLAHSDALRQLLETLHGEAVHIYESVQVRFAVPHDERHTIPTHQDARYINPDMEFFAYWIPLVDIPVGDGGLAVAPGSHHDGLHDHEVSHDYYSYYMGEERPQRCIDVDAVSHEWATADFRAGDLLVFESLVAHSALPNRSNLVRLSIDGRYQMARRPLVNWQARYSVREGTRRRTRVLELLPDADALDADVREAVVATMLAGDLPLEGDVVEQTLARVSRAPRPGT